MNGEVKGLFLLWVVPLIRLWGNAPKSVTSIIKDGGGIKKVN